VRDRAVLEPEVGDPAVAVAGDGAADLRVRGAGPVAGGELPPREARALVGFGVGCLPGVVEAASPVTTHGTNIRLQWAVRQGAQVPAALPLGMDKG